MFYRDRKINLNKLNVFCIFCCDIQFILDVKGVVTQQNWDHSLVQHDVFVVTERVSFFPITRSLVKRSYGDVIGRKYSNYSFFAVTTKLNEQALDQVCSLNLFFRCPHSSTGEAVDKLVDYFLSRISDPRIGNSVSEMEEILEKGAKLLSHHHYVLTLIRIKV